MPDTEGGRFHPSVHQACCEPRPFFPEHKLNHIRATEIKLRKSGKEIGEIADALVASEERQVGAKFTGHAQCMLRNGKLIASHGNVGLKIVPGGYDGVEQHDAVFRDLHV